MRAIDCEDHGHRSKQTMTVIVAVYLPDSPLHVVSIPCHITVNSYRSMAHRQDSRIAASVVQSQ